jgi:hypothetical protein
MGVLLPLPVLADAPPPTTLLLLLLLLLLETALLGALGMGLAKVTVGVTDTLAEGTPLGPWPKELCEKEPKEGMGTTGMPKVPVAVQRPLLLAAQLEP